MQENFTSIVLCGDQEEIFEHALNWTKKISANSDTLVHYVHDGHQPNSLSMFQSAMASGQIKGEVHTVSMNKPSQIAKHLEFVSPQLIVCGVMKHKAHGHFGYQLAKLSGLPVMCIGNAIPEDSKRLLVVMENDPEARQKLGISWLVSKTLGYRPYVLGVSKDKDADTSQHVNVYMDQASLYMNTRGMTVEESLELGKNIANTCVEYANSQKCVAIAMMTTSESVGFLKGTATEQLFPLTDHAILLVPNKHVDGTGGGGY